MWRALAHMWFACRIARANFHPHVRCRSKRDAGIYPALAIGRASFSCIVHRVLRLATGCVLHWADATQKRNGSHGAHGTYGTHGGFVIGKASKATERDMEEIAAVLANPTANAPMDALEHAEIPLDAEPVDPIAPFADTVATAAETPAAKKKRIQNERALANQLAQRAQMQSRKGRRAMSSLNRKALAKMKANAARADLSTALASKITDNGT